MSLLNRVRMVPLRYAIAALVYTILSAVLIHDWDGYVFQQAATDLLHGHSPYEVAAGAPWNGFLGIADAHVQWYAYPPLPLLLMALTYAPAVLFDLPAPVARVLIKVPVIIGTLLLARVAGALADRLGRGEHRTRVEHAFLWNPFLILVGPVWGMTDTLLMALLLLGVLRFHDGRPREAGLWVAAAVLVKPFALLLALPVVAHALAHRPRRDTTRAAATGALLAAIVCGPFVLSNPGAFWSEVIGFHLTRPAQGLTVWSLWPLALVGPEAAATLSLVAMAVALGALSVVATRLDGPDTPLWLMLGAAAAVLFVNRVVNEQYVVMVVAPLLLLATTRTANARAAGLRPALAWSVTAVCALTVWLIGFHFLTFIPPDIALPLFGVPVDEAAYYVRAAAPAVWAGITTVLGVALPAAIVASGVPVLRHLRQLRHAAPAPNTRAAGAASPSVFAALALAVLAVSPIGSPIAVPDAAPLSDDEARVAAFYYLWWQNPAHDPAVQYGNWGPVSQTPTMGYYTNTRGVARAHAEMMVENGIDAAIVSYHRGEWDRYQVFMQEAAAAGLRAAPLIELNQVYDQPKHHPVNENGTFVPYAAYRLDPATRNAIETFVLDVKEALAAPNAWRIDGRPVVFFYDSYVSGVGFDPADKAGLATTLVEHFGYPHLREVFNDPDIHKVEDVLRHYPESYQDFFVGPKTAHVWREAHLEMHRKFWNTLRADIEAVTGPLYLVSGDAYNERAGFESGTIKSIVNLELFDGSFIYSPSFTWGNNKDQDFAHNLHLWEDRNRWMQAFALTQGRAAIPGLAPAYDDTVNRPQHGFVIPATIDGRDFYDISWESALRVPPTAVGIATFNEFFEGSSIEPSIEFGDRWLADTSRYARALQAAPVAAADTVVIVHERESRLHPVWGEQDEPHGWGLDLIAAASRIVPPGVAALDGREPAFALDTPRLVLADGGRPDYRLSADVHDAVRAWDQAGVAMILFGPAVDPLPVDLERCTTLPDDTDDARKTLQPGDVLRAAGDAVVLERNGTAHTVGLRCDDTLAVTRFKPTGADAKTDAACLAVTIRALAPLVAPHGPDTCTVPTRTA